MTTQNKDADAARAAVTGRKENIREVVDGVNGLSGELRAMALARTDEMLADGWAFGGIDTRFRGTGKRRHIVAVKTHWWRCSGDKVVTTAIEDEQEIVA